MSDDDASLLLQNYLFYLMCTFLGPRNHTWEIDLENRVNYSIEMGKKLRVLNDGDILIVVTGPTRGEDWPGSLYLPSVILSNDKTVNYQYRS